MSANQKIEAILLASLELSPSQIYNSDVFSAGIDLANNSWQLIVRYINDLKELEIKYPSIKTIPLLNGYGIILTPKQFIEALASEENIIYMEKPRSFYFNSYLGRQASCINSAQNIYPDNLTGRNTLIAIIDSGIDYTHPDFKNPNGSTRIKYIWDQTILSDSSDNPVPFGSLYDENIINLALQSNTAAQRLSICPSIDISGHGTHVAGIAAGNGAASNGLYRGVAYEADLIIVKLAPNTNTGFPGTVQIMTAVDFCIRTSLELNTPVSINLSLGNTYGSHSGTSLLETYLDSVMGLYQSCIVVGSGNEGSSAGHATFSPGSSNIQQISVGDYTPSLSIMLWKRYWDKQIFNISSPNGSNITVPTEPGGYNFSISGNNLYVYIGEPSPYSIYQEIFLELQGQPASYITSGIWNINNIGENNSNTDLWLSSSGTRSQATRFLTPNVNTTLTIPSTASKVISVGAYDSSTDQIASFSGRGFTWGTNIYKPDLIAPGVNITACAPGGNYSTRSGTSMATPFVTGCCAALMQWGIVLGNDPYLYGEKMRAFLINGARRLPGETNYPSPVYGWGALCLRNTLPL